MGGDGVASIAKYLSLFPNRIQTWYLPGNYIRSTDFHLLSDQWQKSTSVTSIWLKRNPLGMITWSKVSSLIKYTVNLHTLDLEQTGFGEQGVIQLFQSLLKHDQPIALRHIYLGANGVGGDGATAIANYLNSSHCKLVSLHLTNNYLGNRGATALAEGLKSNTSITRLSLASVAMSDDGVIALSEALQNHPNLTALDLSQSPITDEVDAR